MTTRERVKNAGERIWVEGATVCYLHDGFVERYFHDSKTAAERRRRTEIAVVVAEEMGLSRYQRASAISFAANHALSKLPGHIEKMLESNLT